MDGKTIGEKIYQLRKQKGINQEVLSEVLDVTRQSVSRWESGSNIPETSKIIEIAKYFEVPVSYLLDGDDTAPADLQSYKTAEMEEKIQAAVSKAMEKYRSKSKSMLIKIAAGITAVALCFGIYGAVKISTLENKYEYLQSSYSMAQSQIYSLQSQLSMFSLPAQTESEVFSNIDIDFGAFNFENSTVEVVFNLSLKQFTDQTEISVAINNGSEIVRGELQVENGIVTDGKIEVPLSNNFDITATISDNGNKQNEILPSLIEAENMSNVQISGHYSNHVMYNQKESSYDEQKGMVVDIGEILFSELKNYILDEPAYISTEIIPKIYINEEFIAVGRYMDEEEYFEMGVALPDLNEADDRKYYAVMFDDVLIKTGDDISVKLEISDSFGRTYEIDFAKYKVEEDATYLRVNSYQELDYLW
ncbi:MAG: helix-turn-helix transcriptional regulator [Bacillota bacterium]